MVIGGGRDRFAVGRDRDAGDDGGTFVVAAFALNDTRCANDGRLGRGNGASAEARCGKAGERNVWVESMDG